ncbi:MAG: hypothetical protein R3279_06475 [Putridiphycobacter sp.]|nr:hypothetical protein [Putridiphycobacter sp.]
MKGTKQTLTGGKIMTTITTNLMADTVISLEEMKQAEIAHVLENSSVLLADTVIDLIKEIEEKYAY